ncbi:hypothetical protein SAMN05216352_1037 [Alteribacillus bidgolensis]|uniref:Uncharacterized protein n=1 Tax=Alteribacillus bidgolensis TaxID=930129 RepID=A0A1G8FMG0_9BACI|nr:hypothetical protein SAMN05216352_1037 [Alteribacillus bidgolensis]
MVNKYGEETPTKGNPCWGKSRSFSFNPHLVLLIVCLSLDGHTIEVIRLGSTKKITGAFGDWLMTGYCS